MFGLGTVTAVALRFFYAQEAVETLGPIHSLYLNRLAALFSFFIFMIAERITIQVQNWPKSLTLRLVILQSLLEMLALGAFHFGSTKEGRIGVNIGFSVITVLSAWIWLG